MDIPVDGEPLPRNLVDVHVHPSPQEPIGRGCVGVEAELLDRDVPLLSSELSQEPHNLIRLVGGYGGAEFGVVGSVVLVDSLKSRVRGSEGTYPVA